MNDVQTEEKTIVLDYDLFSLPTAQHKAGLAGLLLMIESMRMRKMKPLPEVKKCTASGARISFTEESMKLMFDDLYKGKKVVTKKSKEEYIPALKYLEGFGMTEIWIKAWRDCIGNVIRKGTAIGVFKRGYTHAQKNFNDLLKEEDKSEKPDASLLIPGEATNAERVEITGTRKNNLLLHFTLLPTLLFVPRFIVKNQKTKQWDLSLQLGSKRRCPFFVLVIPEPSDLKSFVEEAKDLLKSLETEVSGYRPKAALIDIPAEGGLEYLRHLTRERVATKEGIKYSLSAVEIFHLEKQGNNIRTPAAERILPDKNVLEDYDAIRKSCRNPLFKSQRIRNTLVGNPWYTGMQTLFANYPWYFFIWSSSDTPRRFLFFGYDANRKFRAVESELKNKGGKPMNEKDQDDQLARRVYRLIQAYVNYRTEEKSGKKYEDFKSNKDEKGRPIYPKEYREAREKVCSDAFLAMRGRREKDFVEYFTGTICSVPQWLPEEEYLAVTQALIAESEKVKTLAMLALSAWSYLPGTSPKEGGKS